jgi:flagellar biosynthesis protein FlhA
MVIADQWDSVKSEVPEDAIIGIDPTYQTQAYWLKPEDAKTARSVTAVDSTDVIVTHLQECVRKHVDEVMTKTDVLKLMELVRSQDPTLVNDLVPTIISTSDLRKIFVNLIREKVSIKDIIFVFERLCDYARFSKEPDILSERLRAALGRQICLTNVDRDKVLYALTLSPEWEKTLDDSCQRTELGTMFLLNPMQVQDLIESTAMTLMRAHQSIGMQPVILCSPRIRLPLFQLLERHIPTIVVISYSELITDIKVDDFYEGRCCQHKETGHYYTIVGQGLMKMEDGLWYDSVVYRGENWRLADKKVTIFTKRLSDFNKEFNLL